jgi:hypothetical protein
LILLLSSILLVLLLVLLLVTLLARRLFCVRVLGPIKVVIIGPLRRDTLTSRRPLILFLFCLGYIVQSLLSSNLLQ